MISSFSRETCEQLQYYVYRLIDPRNGLTFYVGKGKNDRVFAHVRCALKDYNGGDYVTKDDDENDLKLQTILDITNSGLEVIHLIHRFGMNEKTALEVEGALIDAYYSLTNKASGYHNSDFGISNAEEIEKRFSMSEYEDQAENPKYIIIKTNKWRIDEVVGIDYSERLYNATKWCWKVNPRNAMKHPYVLSVVDGVVKEVYIVDNWSLVEDGRGRYEFFGEVAEIEVRNKFIEQRIPSKYRKRGQASPVLYSKA